MGKSRARTRSEVRRLGRQRIQAQDALRAIVQTAPVLVVLTDLEGRILLFNRACEELTGYTQGEAIGKTLSELLLPAEWVPVVQERFTHLGDGAMQTPHVNPWATKSGQERLIEWRCVTLNGRRYGTTCVLGMGIDITQRRQAEHELFQSRERFRTSVEAMLDPFAIGSSVRNSRGEVVDFRWEYANDAACQFAGKTQAQLMGKRLLQVFPNLRKASLFRDFRNVVETGKPLVADGVPSSTANTRPQHAGRFYDVRAVKLEDGLAVTWRDVTERKQAEQMRAQLAAIVEASADAIISTTPSGEITSWNMGAQHLFGYQAREVLGRDLSMLALPQRSASVSDILARLRRGERVEPYHTEALRKDRRRIDVAMSFAPILDGRSRVVAISGIARDITEQRELEAEVLSVSESERHRIGQDLHDSLGQHLTGLTFMSEVLQQDLAKKKLLEAGQAENLVKLAREALDLTRSLARGLYPVDMTPRGLMTALRELAARVSEQFKVQCLFRCGRHILVHNISTANHLYHIVQEAVTNALKHGKATRIVISARQAGGQITLSVRNNGAALPQDLRRQPGMGLRTMKYRAVVIGAMLDIGLDRQGRTVVTCCLPASRAAGRMPREKRGLSRPAAPPGTIAFDMRLH